MALHLVTGYSGKAHITSADQGALNAATFGRGNYVLNAGQQFTARVITNNSINVLDGEVIMQGRHIRMESGAFEKVTIENGAQGYFRNDLICIRYAKDSITGIENAAFVVIKGNPDASAAIDPAHNKGSILDGILTVDFPLYRVPLNGLNIGALVPLFEAKGNIDERMSAVETGKVDKVQGKGLSTNDYSNAEKQQVASNKNDIANIKSGATKVGKASTADSATKASDSNNLGGKGASEYALEEQIKSNSIWNELTSGFDLNNAFGKYRTPNGDIISSLLNLPSAWTAGELSVDYIPFNSANTYGVQILTHKFNSTVSVYQRTKNSATWGAWEKLATTADLANYLPKSGGKVIASDISPLKIDRNDNTTNVYVEYSCMGKILGQLGFNDKNTPYFRDTEGGLHKLLHTDNVGEYALSKDGGTLDKGKSIDFRPVDSGGNAVGSYFKDINNVRRGGVGALFDNGVLNYLFASANDEPWKNNVGLTIHTDAIKWKGADILHTGNSAKVLVSSTPLTAVGSVRVW